MNRRVSSEYRVSALVFMALALLSLILPHGDGLAPWLHSHVGSLCPFHTLLKIPCPGCGMTRSILLTLQGEWKLSWQMHPLGIPMTAFWIVYLLRPSFLQARLQNKAVQTLAVSIVLISYSLRLSNHGFS